MTRYGGGSITGTSQTSFFKKHREQQRRIEHVKKFCYTGWEKDAIKIRPGSISLMQA